MYLISQGELETLNSSLKTLKTLNEQSQTELKMLRSELAASKADLTEAKKQTAELRSQLDGLIKDSRKQEDSLRAANESLKTYSKEEQRTRLRIKAQRNAWETAAVCLLAAWAAK